MRKRENGFTPLEKTTDFNQQLLSIKIIGHFLPRTDFYHNAPVNASPKAEKLLTAQTVRERSSLTGFTLVEILAVLMIIAIVASIMVTVGGPALIRAKKGKVQALISAMEVAASMYKAELNGWPPDDYIEDDTTAHTNTNGAECLYFYLGRQLTVGGQMYGPYMSFREQDISDLGSGRYKVIDPWTQDYGYYADTDNNQATTPPYHNKSSIDIFSKGPDKTTGIGANEGNEADDINNW